jgi:hypothetical protein
MLKKLLEALNGSRLGVMPPRSYANYKVTNRRFQIMLRIQCAKRNKLNGFRTGYDVAFGNLSLNRINP